MILLAGCTDSSRTFTDTVPAPGCRAFDCHQSAPLSIYPPASGEHRTHLGLSEYGPNLSCGSCHSGYNTRVLHKNGFINGYNWLIGKKTSGLVVHFGADVSATSSFDQAASTCSGTDADMPRRRRIGELVQRRGGHMRGFAVLSRGPAP